MMSGTHIVVGMSAALLLPPPATASQCVAAVIGGALGGVICDLDAGSGKNDIYNRDAICGRVAAALISVAALLADIASKGAVSTYFSTHINGFRSLIGAAAIAALCLIGRKTAHRTFTHSLLAFALFSFSVFLFCPPLARPFMVGFLSHLSLDILNYKPLLLFYPWKKGFSLKLCYAKSPANTAVFVGGLVTLAAIAVVYAMRFA